MTIDNIISNTLGHEGGYCNNPLDRGGATNWGITEKVARVNGFNSDMKTLTKDQAIQIYKNEYFIKPNFNLVSEISLAIAQELFDTGVNMGISTASKFLQEALNLLNRNQKLYPDISVDGRIGQGTINTLKKYFASFKEAERLMLKTLNGLQFIRYYDIAKKDTTQEEFMRGWVSNRVSY